MAFRPAQPIGTTRGGWSGPAQSPGSNWKPLSGVAWSNLAQGTSNRQPTTSPAQGISGGRQRSIRRRR